MLSAMRYKEFVWPHNPRTFRVRYARRVAVLDVPGGHFQVQELGQTCRIMQGEGEFYGPQAYETFARLAQVFAEDGYGTLSHPLWYEGSAHFTALELTQEPRQDYVAYAFTFTETRQTDAKLSTLSSTGYHTVKVGDTLWSIANTYGLEVSALLEQNPWLSDAAALRPGQEVLLG